jgi:hypothetical protein
VTASAGTGSPARRCDTPPLISLQRTDLLLSSNLCVEVRAPALPGRHQRQPDRVLSCAHTLTGYLNSLSECIAYPVGTSCSVGSAVAVPCAPGAYNNRTAGDVCVKCAPRAPSKSWLVRRRATTVHAGLLLAVGRGRRTAAPWQHTQERLAQRDDVRRSVRRIPGNSFGRRGHAGNSLYRCRAQCARCF